MGQDAWSHGKTTMQFWQRTIVAEKAATQALATFDELAALKINGCKQSSCKGHPAEA